ncbi:hypothetical protein [Falsiroseomonas stagni]|uniref:Uncharacterized protein n=1 Tax=Falsiroseomonas stagni DSM 19981 TaxID=1123062 RepID=A0A1I3X7A3_9PROT|nr:hypothetical protein [Falsiroseomonas stagni]SFK15533.1 hypothetical protein SAMN02745775_10147 [Falsiroseomonas stagni DSM 19981]
MRAWPMLALVALLALPAAADGLPEIAQMRGPGFGCAAPFLLHPAGGTPREVMAEDPPPFRRAMLTCLAEPGNRKRPLRQT